MKQIKTSCQYCAKTLYHCPFCKEILVLSKVARGYVGHCPKCGTLINHDHKSYPPKVKGEENANSKRS